MPKLIYLLRSDHVSTQSGLADAAFAGDERMAQAGRGVDAFGFVSLQCFARKTFTGWDCLIGLGVSSNVRLALGTKKPGTIPRGDCVR
jgi:hypothetical protein